jgi:hypothetical protein
MNASPVTTQNFNIVSFQKIFLFFFNPYIGVSVIKEDDWDGGIPTCRIDDAG